MTAQNILVFGATGNVASIAAAEAASLGAHVYLAMRDPSKPIPSLDSAPGTFTRVQADLTDPASVLAAAKQSSARTAFIYRVFQATDHMRGAIEALHAGGVEFIVFLSSASLKPGTELAAYGMEDFIGFIHAQTEIALRAVYGQGKYAALRPSYFASNMLRYAPQVKQGGVVTMPYPGAKMDFITEVDMGRVAGNLLVKGAEGLVDGDEVVFLAGPQLQAHGEVVEMMGKAAGKDTTVEAFGSDEEAVRWIRDDWGLPEVGAKHLVEWFGKTADGEFYLEGAHYAKAVANIEKYGGKKPTTVQEWVEANKEQWV